MSAGRAGASLYNSNVNGNQGGGNKKGGLATTTNKKVQFVLNAIRSRAYSSPDQRKMIYCVNQLGGIGRPSKMFAPTADGSCASCSREAKAHNFVVFAYRQLLGRGADQSGLRKYTKQILNDRRGLGAGMNQVRFDLTNSPEGRKYTRILGSVEAQKRIDATNTYIENATTVPDNFTPSGGEDEDEDEDEEESDPCQDDDELCARIKASHPAHPRISGLCTPLKKKIEKLLIDCPGAEELDEDDLRDYFLEFFQEKLDNDIADINEREDLTEEEKNDRVEKATALKNKRDADTLGMAQNFMRFFDTNGNARITREEMSATPFSDKTREEIQAKRVECQLTTENTFFKPIQDFSSESDNNYINEEDWTAYIDSGVAHPAFYQELWNSTAQGTDVEMNSDGEELLMFIPSLNNTVIPLWKMTNNPEGKMTDAEFINYLDNELFSQVEQLEYNISSSQSFMMDTNGTKRRHFTSTRSRFSNGSFTIGSEYDTYIFLFDSNGEFVKADDDSGEGSDARVTLNQDEITYDDSNKAVYYALVVPYEVGQYRDWNADGTIREEGDGKIGISFYQNMNCGVSERLCPLAGEKFQVNQTIINGKINKNGRDENSGVVIIPKNSPDAFDDDERVSLDQLNNWYSGAEVQSVDGSKTYAAHDGPSFGNVFDYKDNNCHKWFKITLNNKESCGDDCEEGNLLDFMEASLVLDPNFINNPDIKFYLKTEAEQPMLTVGGSTESDAPGFKSIHVYQCVNDEWVSIYGSGYSNGGDYRGQNIIWRGDILLTEWNYIEAGGHLNVNKLKIVAKYIHETEGTWLHTFYWKPNETPQGEFYNCQQMEALAAPSHPLAFDLSEYNSPDNHVVWAKTTGNEDGLIYALPGGEHQAFYAPNGYTIILSNPKERVEYNTKTNYVSSVSDVLTNAGDRQSEGMHLPAGGYGGIFWKTSTGQLWDHWEQSFVAYARPVEEEEQEEEEQEQEQEEEEEVVMARVITGDVRVYDRPQDMGLLMEDIFDVFVANGQEQLLDGHLVLGTTTSNEFAEYLQNNWTLSINEDMNGAKLADGEWSEFSNLAPYNPDVPAFGDSTFTVNLSTTPSFTPNTGGQDGWKKIRLVEK